MRRRETYRRVQVSPPDPTVLLVGLVLLALEVSLLAVAMVVLFGRSLNG